MLSKKLFQKIVEITENQRVLVYKNQQLIDVLTPGKHKCWDFKNELSFEYFDINTLYFSEQNAERLYRNNPQLNEHIFHCKLSNTEVGLLYVNDLLEGIVAPSEQLYLWQDAGDIRLEKVSIDEEIALDDKTLFLINRAGANTASRLIKSERTVAVKPIADLNIAKEHIGLLYVNGQLLKQLTPGHYGFWQFNHEIELKTFDCRTQLLEISGQEILSKDRVSLRINLSANIKVHDAQLAARSVDNVNDFVYKALQLALREAVGTKSLDDILLDKLYVNETVKELVAQSLTDIGITLENVGVKDIILPGEMKIILNQVVEAQKAAEANVIKRREETSATRSLHNTAKMIENNPTLMRLKELEALEKVAERINNLTVYGGLEGLMNGAVKIA
ncbi:slipin family protein [Pseudoalteromonas rhizosphaerae]|uniref:Slipin family protein n=1 Tax=Pseudoalteromonas rhizosphaerae TaxID=2518973 RepID=A0ABW8L7N0_9GAMM